MAFNNTSREDILKKLESADANVRNSAIIAAGETGDSGFIEYLEKLCNVSDPATRYFAKKTIKKIKDGAQKEIAETAAAASAEALFDIENFKIWLLNPNPERRLQALKNIYDNPPHIVLPVLSERLKEEKDERIIATLVKLLGKIGGVEQINTICKFLSHDDLRVRANAIEGLEFIGSEKIIPFIAPFLNDLDNRIKANAIKALAKFSSVETLSVVAAMMRSDHLWMRDSAIFALSHIATEDAVTMLNTLLNDADKSISNRAMQALLKIGSPAALKFIDDFRSQSKESAKTSNIQMRAVLKDAQRAPEAAQAKEIPDKKPEQKKESQPEPRKAAIIPIQQQAVEKTARTPQVDLNLDAAPKHEEDSNDFEKLKNSGQHKKTSDPITIYQDQDNIISSNFKGLDDNFYEYVAEIKFIALGQSNDTDRKKVLSEKKENPYDELASLQQKSGGASDSKITAEMKKKIVMDQLRGLNKHMDGKNMPKK